MTDYAETKIVEVDDADFQTLITELCVCGNWGKDEFERKSLANLFNAFVMQGIKLNLNDVLIDSILAQKIKNLAANSVVYAVCCELARRSNKPMDNMMGKSVFALIKQCYKAVNPALPRSQKPTRRQRENEFNTILILRRRSNGSDVWSAGY